MKKAMHAKPFRLHAPGHKARHARPESPRTRVVRAVSLCLACICLLVTATVYPASAATGSSSMSSLQNKLNKLSQSIKLHEQELNNAKKKEAAAKALESELKERVSVIQDQISVLSGQIASVQNSIGLKEQEISAKETEIAEKETEIEEKELEIQGVGYRAAKQGKNLVMNLGYSHQVIVPETDGITIDVPDPLKIVINGIEISSWGHDLKNGQSLIDLLEAVSAAAGDMRLRLGSLEPRTITEDFCRRASKLPNLCPHFHLSLQSGCDETLRRMNRKYDTARFYESVTLLRQYFHRPAVTTDLICGFPDETNREFEQTMAFIEKCAFADMHIFPYSVRPGTKAAELVQFSAAVKEERTRRAVAVARTMHRAYLEGCVGQTYPVLYEQEKDGLYTGHAPNYCEVCVRAEDLHNKIIDTKIVGIDGDVLIGELT